MRTTQKDNIYINATVLNICYQLTNESYNTQIKIPKHKLNPKTQKRINKKKKKSVRTKKMKYILII